MTNSVADIQIGVNLIDDYLYLEEAPVQQDLVGRFVAVHNPTSDSPTSELLAVDGDGALVHFQADPSSNTGWSKTVVTTCAPPSDESGSLAASNTIVKLAGFYDKSGMLNVLVYFQSTQGDAAFCATWMQCSPSGAWSPATLSSNAKNALEWTYQTDVYVDTDGNGYFYGVSGAIGGGAFFLATYDARENNIQVIYTMLLSDFEPAPGLGKQAAFRMATGSDGNQLTILWVDTPSNAATEIYYQGATVTVGKFQTSFAWSSANNGEPYVFKPNLGTFAVSDLMCLPGDYGADSLLLRDASNTLYLIAGYNKRRPTITALSGAGATQPVGAKAVATGCDSTGVLTIFAIDSDGSDNLWYLQQQSPSDTLDPTAWVNLGGQLFGICCRSSMIAGPELFSAEFGSAGPTVYHMDRSLSNPVWSTRKIAAPVATSADPTNIASYTMELTTLDAYGNAVPNAMLSVVADQATTVIRNLVACHIGPNTSIPIQMDAGGQASIQLQCDSLMPPVVTYSVTDGSTEVSRWCQGDVVEVNTQEQALPPLDDSVAPTLQTVSGQTLIDNGLFDTSGYSSQSDALTAANYTAGAINATGQWMSGNPNDPTGSGMLNTEKIRTPHWQIDFTHPDGLRFRELARDEARAIIARSRDGSTPQLLGGSLGSVFGDVAHFFKKEWQKLHQFTASLENDVLTITLAAEEGTQSFVISTVKEAGAALETVFAKIRQIADDIYNVIKDVIAWLKMLFDWQDILNTHQVIKQCVNATLDNLAGVDYGKAQQQLEEGMGWIESSLDSALNELAATFGDQTYNAFANAAATAAPSGIKAAAYSPRAFKAAVSGDVLAGTTTANAQKSNASQCNYAWSKSKTNASALSSSLSTLTLAGAGGGMADSSCNAQSILAALGSELESDLIDAGQQMVDYITDNLDSPASFFDVGIAGFLLDGARQAMNVAVDGAEDILLAVLKIAACGITQIKKLLNAKLDIPVLSWLYKNVITGTPVNPGDDLSLLDLLCLVAAVPTTIIYKVLYGAAPFTGSDAGTIASQGLLWPIGWPNLAGATEPLAAAVPLASGSTSGQGLTALPSGLAETLGIAGGIAQVYATINQACADGVAASEGGGDDPLATLTSWVSIGITAFQWGVAAPSAITPNNAGEPMDAAQTASMAAWALSVSKLQADMVFAAVDGKDLEFQTKVGPVVDSLFSLVFLGIGIYAAVEQAKSSDYSGWDVANSLVGPLGGCFTFLTTVEDGLLVLYPMDAVCGMGSMATQIGSATAG